MKISTNRKAYYDFSIILEVDCGIVLIGNEVKSIRRGDVTISDSFIYLKDGEVWAKNIKVAKYKQSHSIDKHDENRDKKLLLNRKEINKIERLLENNGVTIITLGLFILNNRIKVKIAVATGKKERDKRESIKKRDIERELRRI